MKKTPAGRQRGRAIFLVEQNAFAALHLSDRGYVMVNGNAPMHGCGKVSA